MKNKLTLEKEDAPINQTSLLLAIIFSLVSYIVTFFTFFYEDHGVIFSTLVFDYPSVFSGYLAQAFGGSIIFPIIHVGIVFLFESKRNSSSRRNIFIGWSIAIIFIQVFSVTIGALNL